MTNELSIGDEIPAKCELIEVHVTQLRLLFNPWRTTFRAGPERPQNG